MQDTRKLQRPPCKRKTLLTYSQVALSRHATVRERLPAKGRTQKHFPMASKQDPEKILQDVFLENKMDLLVDLGNLKMVSQLDEPHV